MKKIVLHILNTGSFSGAENVVITMINAFRKYDPQQYKFVYVSGRLYKRKVKAGTYKI